MRNQITPFYAPDGMGRAMAATGAVETSSNSRPAETQTRQSREQMEDDRYDDGLVHGHAWAAPAHRR